MGITKLKNYLEQFSPIPEKEWQFFLSRLEERIFPKKTVILRPGQIENHVSFVDEGVIRYFIDEDERDITFEIAVSGHFATAYDSFLTRTPVRYCAETLTDTRLYSIHYSTLQEMYTATSVGDRIGRLAAEELYIRKNRRQLALLKDDATKRYNDLVRDQPQFLQQVPLKYIASYIGITPQALSRIRRH